MRRKSDVAKYWPLLHRFFAAKTVSGNGGFCAVLPASSPGDWRRVPAARAHNLHVQGYNRENSNFKRIELSGQTPSRAEQPATERIWKDTLLSSPGALSADVETQYLFITDTNHHRIVIANGDGKVVDCALQACPGVGHMLSFPFSALSVCCDPVLGIGGIVNSKIGSSPGMEDGTFETAQLCYPASAVFDADRNFLYIADSENHVIRRADLSTRTLSTVNPTKMTSESTIWGRFLRWTGASISSESEHESGKAGRCGILIYPWHLKFTEHGLLLAASRSFENVWVVDASSGEVTEFHCQDSEVVSEEFCRKANDVKETEDMHTLILHEMKGDQSTVENPWQIRSVIDIVSRVVRLHNKLFYIDTEGQMIRNYDLETGRHDTLQFSNLGLLGLPYWWSLSSPSFQSTNRVNTRYNLAPSIERDADKLDHTIHIPPGRCLLCINPVLPRAMVWAAPLEDGSIWRQAKGSVVELSMLGGSLISHKISSAQQWIDDLDDLDDLNSDTRGIQELTFPPQSGTGIPLYTLVDASLGAGEVIIDAVLYLKYAVSLELRDEFQSPGKGTEMQGVLQERALQWEDQIFLKHLHVKVRLEIATSAPEERTHHITVNL